MGADNRPCTKLIVCETNPKEMTFIPLRPDVQRMNELPSSSSVW